MAGQPCKAGGAAGTGCSGARRYALLWPAVRRKGRPAGPGLGPLTEPAAGGNLPGAHAYAGGQGREVMAKSWGHAFQGPAWRRDWPGMHGRSVRDIAAGPLLHTAIGSSACQVQRKFSPSNRGRTMPRGVAARGSRQFQTQPRPQAQLRPGAAKRETRPEGLIVLLPCGRACGSANATGAERRRRERPTANPR